MICKSDSELIYLIQKEVLETNGTVLSSDNPSQALIGFATLLNRQLNRQFYFTLTSVKIHQNGVVFGESFLTSQGRVKIAKLFTDKICLRAALGSPFCSCGNEDICKTTQLLYG